MERTQRMRSGTRGATGFTLLEMMIVVVILGLIAVLIVSNVGRKGQEAKVKLAHVGVTQVAGWVESFQFDVGRYPTAAEGLKVLIEKPQAAEGWNPQGYVGKNTLPKDPWNNDYVYEWDATKNWYVIKSLGADGKPGGEGDAADIDNRS